MDIGSVHSSEGWAFTGYLAAVKYEDHDTLEVVMDYGTLQTSDGR